MKLVNVQVTHLESALSGEHDSILPSQGFTDSVMAAVLTEGPEPLRFPWRRALPGLIAGGAALAGFAWAELRLLERMPAAATANTALDWQSSLAPILHRITGPDATWTLLALLIPLVCLWLTRRFVFDR